MSYIRNNIEFRIVAAKALESFKNSQAFMLNEIDKAKFDITAKEILLLQYDTWFNWCLFAERFCLKHRVLTDDHIGMMLIDATNKDKQTFDIMNTNFDIFDRGVVDLYEKTHGYLFDFFKRKLNSFADKESIEVYPRIIRTLTSMLNATLFELHEINSIVTGTEFPFVSIDEVGVEYFKENNISIPTERYKLYRELKDLNDVILKCYVENEDEETITQCGIQPLKESGANVQLMVL